MGAKILVADDDRDIRKLLKIYLELEGYDVYLAATPEEALELAASHQPDLLILDAMVPKACSAPLHREIRERAGIPCGRAIVVSGYPYDYYESRFGSLDGARFVAKPFDPDDLVELVGSVLEKARQA